MRQQAEHRELYERLRRHYASMGAPAPPRKEMTELLQLVFSPEEAELAMHIPLQGKGRTTVKQLARETGKGEVEVEAMVQEMGRKGMASPRRTKEGETSVNLWLLNRLFWTTTFGDGIINDEKLRIVELREKLWQAGWPYMLYPSRHPEMRVLPYEKGIDSSAEVAPYERASYLVETARTIALIACSCRVSLKKCLKPIYRCFHFNEEAEYLLEYRGARLLGKEECLALMDDAGKQGLVLSTINSQQRAQAICSCCPDCCTLLRPYVENNIPGAIGRSNFLPSFDWEKCKLDLVCQRNCPVGAIGRHLSHDESRDHMIVVEDRCIGCGVCAATCPQQAIKLKKVRNAVPASSFGDLLQRAEQELAW